MHRFLLSLSWSVIDPFVIFLHRLSDLRDAVLLTVASSDGNICCKALNEGWAVIALELDHQLIMKAASDNLVEGNAHTAKNGMWARVLSWPKVTVGRSKLPAMVLRSNVPFATPRELNDSRSNSHGYASDVEFTHERKVATAAAGMHDFEIRMRGIVDGLCSPGCLRCL